MTITFFAVIVLMTATACGNDIESALPQSADQQLAISEDQAMAIAMTDLDSEIYTATSTIVGPMENAGESITAYEVTVNGGDHIILRYVDAMSGELLNAQDAIHEIPSLSDLPEDAKAAYYTSCPAGWPLCIANPSSIYFYSQRDGSWSNQKLGNSSTTIGQAGCVLTSYAMMLRKNGRGTNNPSQLNDLGKRNSCFSGADIKHDCLAKAAGATYAQIDVNNVWGKLASGRPVVSYGYSTCLNSNHAQMLWGHDGSRYIAKDPWYDWTNQDQPMCANSPVYRVME